MYKILIKTLSHISLRVINSFGWQTLRAIQNNKLIKSMYVWLFIVPILAKIVSYVDDKIQIVVFEKIFILDLVLPFSWQSLFFTAFLFVIANLLFVLFAPNIIKEHINYQDFINSGKGEKQLEEYMISPNLENTENLNRLRDLAGIKKPKEEDKVKNKF